MSNQVTLSSAINSNLLSLQNTKALLDQTQLRLSTGKKVNSALDNPGAFFAAQALDNRSGDLSNVLDAISQGVQTIQTANDGITAITSLLQQAESVAQQALSESNANAGGKPTDAASLTASFNQILQQITNLSNDASYQGSNLLNSSTNTLTIIYDETSKSTQTIQGVNFTAGSTGTQGTGYAAPVVGSLAIPATTGGAPADSVVINGQTVLVGAISQSQLLSNLNTAGAAAANHFTAALNSAGDLVINSTTLGAALTFGGGSGTGDIGFGAVPPSTAAATTGGGLGITNAGNGSGLDWGSATTAAQNISASLTAITNALTTVRAQASTLGQNLGTVQTYQSFNQNLINDLKAGSSDLTAADTNAESAALLTLQTQEQLGISALSLASQAQQAVLKLFP